jgi:hypothetical protein
MLAHPKLFFVGNGFPSLILLLCLHSSPVGQFCRILDYFIWNMRSDAPNSSSVGHVSIYIGFRDIWALIYGSCYNNIALLKSSDRSVGRKNKKNYNMLIIVFNWLQFVINHELKKYLNKFVFVVCIQLECQVAKKSGYITIPIHTIGTCNEHRLDQGVSPKTNNNKLILNLGM